MQKIKNWFKKATDITEPTCVGIIFTLIFLTGALIQNLELGKANIELSFYIGSVLFALYSMILAKAYRKKINKIK